MIEQKIINQLTIILLCSIIPLNIYTIGDNLGTGIQFALFRYQETFLGNNFISASRDIGYCISGLLGWRTVISIFIWYASSFLLIFVGFLYGIQYEDHLIKSIKFKIRLKKFISYFIFLCGTLFLISCFFQYGIFLHGPVGISIPIGIPFIFYLSYYMKKY